MHRRHFIKIFGQSLFAACGLMTYPSLLWAESADDYAFKGLELIQANKFTDAVDILKKAVSFDPENAWAYGNLGRACLGAGQKAEAVSAFRKAVVLNPDDTYSRMMIDEITQKPLPVMPKEKRPPTPLEIQARQEEALMMNTIQAETGLKYTVRRIVIDPGHGGFDTGAVGPRGLKEKDLTLDIALRLHDKLKSGGKIKSFLTRTADYYVPLSERTVIANQHRADLFISIHINAATKRTSSGSETYFCSETASSAEAKKVAAFENAVLKFDEGYKKAESYLDFEEILRLIEQELYWKESGIFAGSFQEKFKTYLPFNSRGVHSANFFVLRQAKMPSILLETGFVSNPDEEILLSRPDVRARIAEAIALGII